MKNTLFFFPKPLFVPIANNFSLYIYNLSYLLLSFTKYKYTVYTGMYFHQNTSYQTQSFPYQTTPNGEIVQNGAGQLPKQWHSNEKSLEMSSSFQYYTNDALDHSGPKTAIQ